MHLPSVDVMHLSCDTHTLWSDDLLLILLLFSPPSSYLSFPSSSVALTYLPFHLEEQSSTRACVFLAGLLLHIEVANL